MINRVLLFVIDGLGIGPLPDAAEHGDAGANTLAHLADMVGGLSLPNMETLGLGHIASIPGVQSTTQPRGCFGRLGFTSRGTDSVAGHWEMNGIVGAVSPSCADGVPRQVVTAVEQALGRKVIGKDVASLGAMLKEYGADHFACGAPMLWTDGRNTCHVAAHEAVMAREALYQGCREAWKTLKQAGLFLRIVAQPVAGEPGRFHAHGSRRDFVAEPPGVTMLDVLNRSGQIVMGIGKVGDLFGGRSLTKTFSAPSAQEAFGETVDMLSKVPRGLLYVGLDFSTDEATQTAEALEDFDRRLPGLFDKLRVGDLVVITGDHGRDLSRPLKRPTREYVPLLLLGPKLPAGVDLGTRSTAADLGQTVADAFGAQRLSIGDSFWEAIKPG
ncbi:MAG: phosphopentomutase [Nitrospira sp.]|nr:phosphopentomutase [Nitrospira sp.]MCP9462090.1 phosphopentomutase [Nitrospira sp.]MCP9475163.1 phosphopentomutase [Nitrospira sp.]